ncbi:MAG: preprotein translocase subunit SecE [Candidatus Omnitrophica bacterium 4484_171]|nr:MAG: preprotein translocase subunit SecE [Candidatus Omnitrophica bacterium 4484_171]
MGLIGNIIRLPASTVKFLKEVRAELKKVSWSTKEELIVATVVVLAGSAFLTIYIALIDIGLSRIMRSILR